MSKTPKTKKSLKNLEKRNYKYYLSVFHYNNTNNKTLMQFKNLLEKMDHIEKCDVIVHNTQTPVTIKYDNQSNNKYYHLVVMPSSSGNKLPDDDTTTTIIYYDPSNIENLFTLLYGLLIGFNRHASFAFHQELTTIIKQHNNKDIKDKITILTKYHNLLFKDLTLKIDSLVGTENAEKNNYEAFKYKLYIDCVNNKCNVEYNNSTKITETKMGGANPIKQAYTAIKTKIGKGFDQRRTKKAAKKAARAIRLSKKVNADFNKTALLRTGNNTQGNNTQHIPVVLHISNSKPESLSGCTYTIVNSSSNLSLTHFVLFNNVGYPSNAALSYFSNININNTHDAHVFTTYNYDHKNILTKKKITSKLSLTADELKKVYDSEAGVAGVASEPVYDVPAKPTQQQSQTYNNEAGYMEVAGAQQMTEGQSTEPQYLTIGSSHKTENPSSSTANRATTPPSVIGHPPPNQLQSLPPGSSSTTLPLPKKKLTKEEKETLYSEILSTMPYDNNKEIMQDIDTDIFNYAYINIQAHILNIYDSMYDTGMMPLYLNKTEYINMLEKLIFISNYNYNDDTKNASMKKAYMLMIENLKKKINIYAKKIKFKNHKKTLINYFNFILKK